MDGFFMPILIVLLCLHLLSKGIKGDRPLHGENNGPVTWEQVGHVAISM
jgi:hypothetical protein